MAVSDLLELERTEPSFKPRAVLPARPTSPAPSAEASEEIRETWSQVFVAWFLQSTGADEHPDGGPVGHRWRMEFFRCVRDPRAFEKYADEELTAFLARETENGEGE